MNKKTLLNVGTMGALLLGLGGCQQSAMRDGSFADENLGLRAQLEQRESELTAAQQQLRERDGRINQLQTEVQQARREAENALASAAASIQAMPEPVTMMPSQPVYVDPFAGIDGVTSSMSGGEVTAVVENDVLFDAGKATLKSSARASLDKVAEVLKGTYRARTIRVAGHTDTDPIKRSGFKSNYHLGFERAYAVRDYLVERGVPAKSIYIASHGPDEALATKKASRRVEIVVELGQG